MNARDLPAAVSTDVPLPRFVQIEPVGQCNLRCAMCAIAYRSDAPAHGVPALLPYAAFTRLLEQFEGVEELHLQGLGEPLMHPEFFRMVRHAVARGLRVSTNSNLTLLTPARARECIESGLDTLHISLDGASAEVYESIRHGASFDKVVRNLGRIVAEKRQQQSVTPHLRIVTVVMRRNLHELADIVALAFAHGVDTIFVQHLSHDFGESALPERYLPMREFVRDESLLGEDRARIRACFAQARERAAALGVQLRLPTLEDERRAPAMYGCDWPWRGAYLTFRGEALPCCMVSTPERFDLGNMLRDGVRETWDGAPYRRLRQALESGEPPEICRSCSVYRHTF